MSSLKGNQLEFHRVVSQGDAKVALAMLAEGADHNAIDPVTRRTPAHCAVEANSVDMLRELRQRGAIMTATDATLNTPLYEAAETGKLRALEWLLDNVAGSVEVKGEALLLASFNGHAEAVESLLARGAPIESSNDLWRTALYQAAEAGRHRVVRALLRRGAEPGVSDVYRRTLLHAAAESGDSSTLSLVLKLKLDVNAADEDGNTPLHCAATTEASVVALLLDNGADIQARNRQGHTALVLATRRKKADIVHLLKGKDIQDKMNKLMF